MKRRKSPNSCQNKNLRKSVKKKPSNS